MCANRGGRSNRCVKRRRRTFQLTSNSGSGVRPGERTSPHGQRYAGKVERASVGDAGEVGSGGGSGDDPGDPGGGVDGAPGPWEVGAAGGGGRAAGLPERIREAAASGDEFGDDRGAAASGAGPGGAVREPGAAAVRAADQRGGGSDPGVVPARAWPGATSSWR